MYPTIFKIGPIGIHSYGLMLTLSFFAGLWYIYKRSPAEKLSFDRMLTVAYILIFAGMAGARLGFVVLHWEDYIHDPLAIINPFGNEQFGLAGLNLYGGVILAIAGAWWYIRRKKLPLLAVFDLYAPTLGLGLGIARIGCFLKGCCFGTPTNLPWGISFPEGSLAYYVFGSQRLHPTQLYSSAYGILLFIILHLILKRKRFDGQVTGVLFMTEAVFRHLIEYVRYYEVEMKFHFLGMEPTYNQLVSVLLFAAGAILYWRAPRVLYRENAHPAK